MPISEAAVVEDIHERMRSAGKQVMTITWPDFYALNQVSKLKAARLEKIRETAKDKFNLIVGYGNNVVTIAQDTNFSYIDAG